MKSLAFSTQAVHGPASDNDPHRALRFPVYDGVSFGFESAEAMADAFSGRKARHAYSRISNPTVEAFERRMNALEGGYAAMATASGMAALSSSLFTILGKGDAVIAASTLFGGTYSLLKKVIEPLGIEIRFAPINDLNAIEQAMDDKVRVILSETISNPGMIVPDYKALSEMAKMRRIVMIADSTTTTPYLFNAKAFGIDIVVHSATKYISGGATCTGGIIVDLGGFDWGSVPSLAAYHRYGEGAFIARLRKEVACNNGGCLSPHNANLLILGLETLQLRMDRICRSALHTARFLENHDSVKNVFYPGLASSVFYNLSNKQFNGNSGGIMTFSLQDRSACFRFLNALSLIRRSTNLGDNKTLAIHPATTIFEEFNSGEKKMLGADEAIVRLSIGIEDEEDIIDDIDNALRRI